MADEATAATAPQGNTEKADAAGTAVSTASAEATATKVETKTDSATAQTAAAAAVETKPDEAGENKASETGEEAGEKKDGEQADSKEYGEFKIPEGLDVVPEIMASFIAVSKEFGLTQEQAQRYIDVQSQNLAKMAEKQETARQTYISEMRAQADALPKEELVACHRFISKYGSPDLVKKMSDPNFYIGNDVDIIKAFALAGRVADGGFVEGTVAGSDGAGSARMLYDKSNMK